MTKDKSIILITLTSALVYLFIVSLQGIDMCDEGFCLSFYQQIYSNPESVQYNFLYYFTGIIGGIWNILFGWGGILSFRILNLLIIILTAYLTYRLTKDLISPIVFSVATFCVIFLSDYGNIVFHHNYFTAFLVSLSLLFFIPGIINNEKRGIFFGGLLIGVAIFARIVNISLLSLGFLFVINYFYERDWKIFFKDLFTALGGCLMGILIVLGIMIIKGDLSIFFQSILENVFAVSLKVDNTHSLTTLLRKYLVQYMYVGKFIIIYLLLLLVFRVIFNLLNHKLTKLLLVVTTIGFFQYFNPFSNIHFYAFLTIPLFISIYVDYKNKSFVLLNSAALIIMYTLPIGSDWGISNMGSSSVWLATFLAIGHYYRFALKKIKENDYSFVNFFGIFIFAFLMSNSIEIINQAYFDKGNRFDKRFGIDNKLANVYTSQVKSSILNELLDELEKHVKPNDEMICFESLPTIHYLTQTIPYSGTPWIWVYQASNFKKQLLFKESLNEKMPIVLRQKNQPIEGNWNTFDPRYNDTELEDEYMYKKNRVIVMNKFLDRNNYQVIWENELFQILEVKN